jgi:hypothetical protein
MIHKGRLRVNYQGRTVEATVEMGSDNRRSLMLQFKAILGPTRGGAWVGRMPVLAVSDGAAGRGEYQDFGGMPVGLEWLQEPERFAGRTSRS